MSDNVSLLKYSLNLLWREWHESLLKSICEYKIDKSIKKINFVFLYLFKRNYLSLLKWVDFLWVIRQFVSLLLNQSDCLLNNVSVCVWIYKMIYWVIYCYIILIYLLTFKLSEFVLEISEEDSKINNNKIYILNFLLQRMFCLLMMLRQVNNELDSALCCSMFVMLSWRYQQIRCLISIISTSKESQISKWCCCETSTSLIQSVVVSHIHSMNQIYQQYLKELIHCIHQQRVHMEYQLMLLRY
jgi:hypothetical protein